MRQGIPKALGCSDSQVGWKEESKPWEITKFLGLLTAWKELAAGFAEVCFYPSLSMRFILPGFYSCQIGKAVTIRVWRGSEPDFQISIPRLSLRICKTHTQLRFGVCTVGSIWKCSSCWRSLTGAELSHLHEHRNLLRTCENKHIIRNTIYRHPPKGQWENSSHPLGSKWKRKEENSPSITARAPWQQQEQPLKQSSIKYKT